MPCLPGCSSQSPRGLRARPAGHWDCDPSQGLLCCRPHEASGGAVAWVTGGRPCPQQASVLTRSGAEHTSFPGTALLLWSDAQILHVGYVAGDLRALGGRGPEGRQSAPAHGGRAGPTWTALPAPGPRGSESVLAHLLRPRRLPSHSPGFCMSSHPHQASQTGPWALEGQTGLRILKLSLCGSRFRGAFCNWVWDV